MAAVYQVSARLVSAEQTTIWSRTTWFLTATGGAVALAGFGSLSLQIPLGIVGFLVTSYFWRSGERSWRFRDHFADLMRAQEEWLGVETLGPMTTGDEQGFGDALRGGKFFNQRWAFRVLVSVIAALYVCMLIHGCGGLTSVDRIKEPQVQAHCS